MNQIRKNEELKITIYQGDENRAKIREVVERNDFFYKSYEQAVYVIKKNMDLAREFYKKVEKKTDYIGYNVGTNDELALISEYSNYITVFAADRGAGKTSTMLSFGKMLQNKEILSKGICHGFDFHEVGFQPLFCIDPTSMEARDSILKIIISRMFLAFEERWQQRKKYDRESLQIDKKENLIQHFQKCYKAIDTLKQNFRQDEIYNDLYRLSELGDSTNLKVELFKLIKEYLEFMGGADSQKQYLLLQIDDVDLNEEMAYEILEDLRKYLMLPNVMIVMAANLKQLRYILEKKFADEYRTLLKFGGSVDIKKCKNMAERYLEKIFPVVSQIHLPQINFAICTEENNLTVEYLVKSDEMEKDKNLLLFRNANNKYIRGFQEILLRLIYEKTGVILLKKPYLHEMLPKSMRELTHFLEFMDTLEDIPNELTWRECLVYYNSVKNLSLEEKEELESGNIAGTLEIRFENLKKFEEYFYEYWCPYNLTVEQQEMVENIKRTSLRDKTARINSLLERFDLEKSDEWNFSEIEYRLNKWILSEQSKEERNFWVFLSTYFSIYKNRMALYDFMQRNYLKSIRILYRERSVMFEFSPDNIFQQSFRINYTRFKETTAAEISEGPKGKYYVNFKNIYIYKRGQRYYFDIFGPFSAYIKGIEYISDAVWKEDRESVEERLNLYQSILRIVFNCELKQKVQEKIENEIHFTYDSELISPPEMVKRIYQCIDDAVNGLEYLKVSSNISSLIEKKVLFDDTFISLAFICNAEIAEFYFDKFKSELKKLIPEKQKRDSLTPSNSISRILRKAFVEPSDWGIDDIVLNDKGIGSLFEVWNKYAADAEEILNSQRQIIRNVVNEKGNISENKDIVNAYETFNSLIEQWEDVIEKLTYKNEGKR